MTSAVCVAPQENRTDLNDLRHGHIVIIAARWLFVSAGLLFVLYRPASVADLTEGVLAVLAIAAVNFFLHTRPLTNRPVERSWAYGASIADLIVISALILIQGTLTGNTRVFYYPAILAFSLVFPPLVTVVLTAGVLGFVAMTGVGNNLDVRVIVAQLLSLGVTALIGWRYREVERRRRARRAEFVREPFASEAGRIEEQEDLFYGQIVCILARWALIGGALFLCLYQAADVSRLERSLIPLMLIIAANFFLQARYMMGLPANKLLLQCAGAIDLISITAIVAAGNPEFFVFYYPVVAAFALVFVRRFTLMFTGLLALGYAAVFVLSPPGIHFNGDELTLAIRLVTLVGTGLLATMYWRIQRARSARED